MNDSILKLGFAITGSFCTFHKILPMMDSLIQQGYDIHPILSYNTKEFDTRFGQAEPFCRNIETLTGKKCMTTIQETETIGPKALFDIMLIAPCTGNTLAKLANGITDTPVLMAAKAHLRNHKPLVLFLSSNDALGMNLKNIGTLLNTKHIYFVPFGQDDYKRKTNSLVSHPHLVMDTLSYALKEEQIQPLLVEY